MVQCCLKITTHQKCPSPHLISRSTCSRAHRWLQVYLLLTECGHCCKNVLGNRNEAVPCTSLHQAQEKPQVSGLHMCGVTICCGCFSNYVCMISKLWPMCFLIEKLMSPAVCLQALSVILFVPARDEKQGNNFGLFSFLGLSRN